MNGHEKKKLLSGQQLRIVKEKITHGHWMKYMCDCDNIVTNLIDGDIVWTRVKFKCGKIQKINVHCLEEI